MKNKRLIIGIIAIIPAIGGALATTTPALEDAHIWIKQTCADPFTCVDSGLDCDNAGNSVCIIRVATTIGGGTFKDIAGYKPDCVTVLKHTTINPQFYGSLVCDADAE